jgi:hypothetical protein
MPELIFHLKKRADATAQLILIREDGTHSVGAVGPADGYGPVHDITHYAFEQTLGLSEGFLGLISSGWEISDFEVKGTAARLPFEAVFAEIAAGELSRQLLMRQVSTLDDFVWAVELSMKRTAYSQPLPQISAQEFASIHDTIAAEWKRWRELPPNGTLELRFVSSRRSDCASPTPSERAAGRLTMA